LSSASLSAVGMTGIGPLLPGLAAGTLRARQSAAPLCTSVSGSRCPTPSRTILIAVASPRRLEQGPTSPRQETLAAADRGVS
jgi:hypothetical protein